MIVLIHVVIALSSIFYTTYLAFRPSSSKVKIAYGLVSATLVTGTYLTLVKPTHLLQSCLEGIIYLSVVTVGIALAQKKLARVQS